MGIAFRGLNKIGKPLYPIVTSTAAKTEMVVAETRRDFVNLQDRCRAEILKNIKSKTEIDRLELPHVITQYLAEALSDERPLTPVDNFDIYKV